MLLLLEILKPNDYPLNKSWSVTLLDKTKDAMEDFHLELTAMSKAQEELKVNKAILTPLKEVNLVLAASTNNLLPPPLVDLLPSMEKLEFINNYQLQDPSLFVLMPLHGLATMEEF